MRILSTLILLFCLSGQTAHAWWNKDWDYRKEFILDTTGTGLAIENSVSDAAILIKLHLGNFTYFNDTLPKGEDIRFVSGDDLTPLKYHIEYYDPLQQVGLIWVKIPRITPGTNLEKIYMYYGNENAVSGADKPGTYGVEDIMVYHFDGVPSDATAYGNNPQTNASSEVAGAAIGYGVEFLGEQSITVASSPSLRLVPETGATASLWMKPTGEQNDSVVLAYVDEEGNSLALRILGGVPYLQYGSDASFKSTPTEGIEDFSVDAWNHVAFTVEEDTLTLYVNGAEVANVEASLGEIGGVFTIGAWPDDTQGFIGQIDQVHLFNVPISLDKLSVYFNNQGPSDLLVRAGADGQQEGAGEGHNYIAFSLSKLTLEGKITTGILTVMLVFGFIIMFAKGMFLSKVRKSTSIFQKRYVGEGETKLGASLMDAYKNVSTEDKKLKDSCLNRVFKVGMRELERRFDENKGATTKLSVNSINAIRASMDTAMVRENQRLQKQMVLLTIAIAGGPFIGLFGTVMGVMITFAEVALAGNVDVNAIAPGISAALVATVAGLAVAIPCLFGYNYLSSQVKEISADMRVFVDEFQARVSEEFGV
jgi:biopolymer transport protein ExbB